jgi:hypothetical protein
MDAGGARVPLKRTSRGTPSTEATVGADTAAVGPVTLGRCAVAKKPRTKDAVVATSRNPVMLDGIRNVKRAFGGNMRTRFLQNGLGAEDVTLGALGLADPYLFFALLNTSSAPYIGSPF